MRNPARQLSDFAPQSTAHVLDHAMPATVTAPLRKAVLSVVKLAVISVDARATRRVAGFQAYERLFSVWHALHLPLIFVLIVPGLVHMIAVNIC